MAKTHITRKTTRKRERTAAQRAFTNKPDYYQKAKFLRSVGLYTPRKPITARKMTRSQKRTVIANFDKLMQHKTIYKGHVELPARRTLDGWKLTKGFRHIDQSPNKSAAGIIKTKNGAIITSRTNKKVKILKDGSILTREKRNGKMRNVYAGDLSSRDVIRMVKDIDSGKFKIPRGKEMRIEMFGNALTATTIENDTGLKMWAVKYGHKLETYIKRRHPSESLVRLEIFNATD